MKSTRSRLAKGPNLSVVLAGLAVGAAVLLIALATPRPAGAAFQGHDGKIVFQRGDGNIAEIYVIDQDGSGQMRLTNNLATDSLPAFSPNGKEVAFTSRRDVNDEIYVMTADDRDGDGNGEDLTRITNTAYNEFQPAFSPDGNRMAFTSNQIGNSEIYVMNSDGTGTPVRLTNNAARDARPAFSPDGDRVAFTSIRDGDNEIYVMDAVDIDGDGNGENLTKITDNMASDTFANFSPDGKALAFTSNRDNRNDEIYVARLDGSGIQTRLTNDQAVDELPAFSPEGNRVAFSSDRNGNFEIYIMDAIDIDGDSNGDHLTQITDNTALDTKPDWGPFFSFEIDEVQSFLNAIIQENPGTPLADELDDAVANLEAAIAALEYESYDRQAALQNIERALSVIQPAVEDGSLDATQGPELMDQLAQVARQIALEALQEAQEREHDPTQIAESQLDLDEGDELRASGAFMEAVDRYKDALVKAEDA